MNPTRLLSACLAAAAALPLHASDSQPLTD